MARAAIVVPCFNEADRLDVGAFTRFADADVARLILVNDGSRDHTLGVLRRIANDAANEVVVLDVQPNVGKGEAVRRGLLEALAHGHDLVGFWDADLATPFDAVAGFIDRMEASTHLEVVVGSRVRLLGRTIERRAVRHYTGRVFATAVSLALGLPVYDTQCGAKLFRATPTLARALATPFLSRWIFDVELLARLGIRDGRYRAEHLVECVYELPLVEWRDVAGSKLRMEDFPTAALDLARIYTTYIRRQS
jgi:glycosyltransferase involved in cell wall biosynthesis